MTARTLRLTAFFAGAILLAFGAPASALDILLTNDDGFEASTLHAVYRLLHAQGYRVIIASEVLDNSGKGGSADFFKPIGPLSHDSRAGFVKAGAPGVGHLPSDDHVFYVDGTPVAAALYGIDVAAKKVWGKEPDLVISGPNYGNNTGLGNNMSGTVNAALICINRGVPALAVSTANPMGYKPFDRLTAGDAESEVAGIVLHLVQAIEQRRRRPSDPLLPRGLGLNVNIPKFVVGAASRLPFASSRVGTATFATPIFVEDLSQDAGAHAFGVAEPALPGVSFILTGTPIGDHSVVTDSDPSSEQNVVNSGRIAISVIHGNHEAADIVNSAVSSKLAQMLNKADANADGAPR